jgi:hypothetical protein
MCRWRAALLQNYIGFEYPVGQPEWWYEIVEGLPNPIVKGGFIDVSGPAGARCYTQCPYS